MTQTLTTDEFLKLLNKSELLTTTQLKRAIKRFRLRSFDTASEAATELVRQRVITPFQGERLLDGRYRGFFIDRYKIRELLGFGGMGCIYIAEDTESGVKVALKVLTNPEARTNGMLTRLQLEAKAGMRLNHPHIVRTYRTDSAGAADFVVMELVRGVNLNEWMMENGLPTIEMACDIARQIARGLQHAHESGIVHRDVKPSNIIIDNTGQARLLDFGLALIEDDLEEERALKEVFGHGCVGTADFVSPEQSVDSTEIDGRADVYSLGCVLFTALCGRPPFSKFTVRRKLRAHRSQKAPSLQRINKNVPKELVAVVEQMMSKDREKRYSTAADAADALQPFCENEPLVFDFRSLLTERARRWQERQPELETTSSVHDPAPESIEEMDTSIKALDDTAEVDALGDEINDMENSDGSDHDGTIPETRRHSSTELSGRRDELTAHLESATAAEASLQTELDAAHVRIEECSDQRQEFTAQFESLEGDVSERQLQLGQCTETQATLDGALDQLKEAVERAGAAAEQLAGDEELAALTGRLAERCQAGEAKRDAAKQEADTLTAEIGQLRQSIAELRQQSEQLESDFAEVTASADELQQGLDRSTAERRAMEIEIAGIDVSLATIQLEDVEAMSAEYRDRLSGLDAALPLTIESKEKSDQALTILEDDELREVLTSLTSWIDSRQSTRGELQEFLAECEAEIATAQRDLADALERRSELQPQVSPAVATPA